MRNAERANKRCRSQEVTQRSWKRICSYAGCTLNTQLNTAEFREATSSSQHVNCSCDPPACLMHCNYLNEDCLAFLFAHETPHTEHQICTLTYTRWQRATKASGRLGERRSWTSWLPCLHPCRRPASASADGSRHGWSCAQSWTHCLVALQACGSPCSLLFAQETSDLEREKCWAQLALLWGKQLFWNGFSGVFRMCTVEFDRMPRSRCPAQGSAVTVTVSHQHQGWGSRVSPPHLPEVGQEPSLPPTAPSPAPSCRSWCVFQQNHGFPLMKWHQCHRALSHPAPVPGSSDSRSEPSKCPVVPPAHLWLKDVSLNWQASATFPWHHKGHIFLTWRVDIFAFPALKYTDLQISYKKQ